MESRTAVAATPVGVTEEAAFPISVAAIDVGSNAIRFVAAEFATATDYRLLREERVPVRLGHDVFLSGRLADEALDGGVAALTAFRGYLDELGIRHCRAVATSAVREAANGEDFVRRVRDAAGIDIEVITGSEEARLVHAAVRSRVAFTGGHWVLVDLGGGSVEVSVVDERGIRLSESHTMGSVRLLEELSVAGAEPGRFRDLLEEYTRTLRFPHVIGKSSVEGLVATGGNIETLARMSGGGRRDERVLTLPVVTLRKLIDMLSRLSFRQRVEELGLREDRADVILPAAMVYERVATLAAVETILVPQVGVKDGLLIDLVDNLASRRSHEDRLDEQAYQGALVLGRRFHFDEAHGAHVARLAVDLFEQLRRLHGLEDGDRRILRAAAVLHDIGIHVNYKRHHKHSHYLIANSELPAFTPYEIQLVAAVARYHRKGDPAPHHAEYMSLVPEDRARVSRLASLLRVAAALDKEQLQRVGGLRARLRDRSVLLDLFGSGDLLLERWALERNKTFFERVFEVSLSVAGEAAA
jgi:exopolyphosphatase / guanosine-5'-triphosphate,3'-diphosphate pyrophosphatase